MYRMITPIDIWQKKTRVLASVVNHAIVTDPTIYRPDHTQSAISLLDRQPSRFAKSLQKPYSTHIHIPYDVNWLVTAHCHSQYYVASKSLCIFTTISQTLY